MWWLMTAAAAAGCDPAAVIVATEVVGQVPASYRHEVALAAFAEACPGPVAQAAEAWVGTPPGYRAQIEAMAVLDDVAAWLAVCPAGPGVLATAMQLRQADARATVFTACGLASRGWFDAAEWAAAPGPTVLAAMAGGQLAAAGVAPQTTRLLVRAMIGAASGSTLPGSTPPAELAPLPYLRPELEMDLAPVEPPLEDDGGGIGGGIGGGLGWSPSVTRGTLATPGQRPAPVVEEPTGSEDDGGEVVGAVGFLPPAAPSSSGVGTVLGATCPPPTWTEVGLRCVVEVTVDAAGAVAGADWARCPPSVLPAARALLARCTFAPGSGSPVRVEWAVR